MDAEILVRAGELWREREAFALATVVWRRSPSSGHLGSKAIIRADGTIEGWLGGACAQPTVLLEALACIGDGQPRLLLLGQPDDLRRQPDDGIRKVPMACESEGAMEIYLEPVHPRPQLVVIGRSPAVFALTRLATDLDWEVDVIDDGGDPDHHPFPDLVRTSLDLTDLGVGAASAIVVGTQGTYDDLALEAALLTDAGYIGLVAADKRASATLALLRDRGMSGEQLTRVTAPAGLDLGPVGNAEIAVAVIAELVRWRATGALPGAALPAGRPHEVDPVCGMSVFASSRYACEHEGVRYLFCGAGCLAAFEKDPGAHLAP